MCLLRSYRVVSYLLFQNKFSKRLLVKCPLLISTDIYFSGILRGVDGQGGSAGLSTTTVEFTASR